MNGERQHFLKFLLLSIAACVVAGALAAHAYPGLQPAFARIADAVRTDVQYLATTGVAGDAITVSLARTTDVVRGRMAAAVGTVGSSFDGVMAIGNSIVRTVVNAPHHLASAFVTGWCAATPFCADETSHVAAHTPDTATAQVADDTATQPAPAPSTSGTVAGTSTIVVTETNTATVRAVRSRLAALETAFSALAPSITALTLDALVLAQMQEDIADLEDRTDTRRIRQSEEDREGASDHVSSLQSDLETSVSTGALTVSGNSALAALTASGASSLATTTAAELTVTNGTTLSGSLTLATLTGGVLTTDASGVVSTTTVGASSITDDSLDFAQFTDSMTLDATTTVAMSHALNFDSGLFYIDAHNDRVGIGDTTPSYTFEVNNGVLGGMGGVPAANFRATDGGTAFLQSQNTEGAWKFGIDGDENFILSDTSNDIFTVEDGAPADSFYLTSAGRIGIGTSTPGEKLTVVGDYLGTGVLQIDGTGDSYVQGNVGIGTTGPDEILHLAGSEVKQIFETTGLRKYYIKADASDAYLTLGRRISGDTADSDDFVLSDTGNVGIGTTSPASKLDIYGTIRSLTQTVPTTGTGLELRYDGTNGVITAYDRDTSVFKPVVVGGSTLSLQTGGLTRLTVDSSGNVGIGTTSPDGLLHVSGSTVVETQGGNVPQYRSTSDQDTNEWGFGRNVNDAFQIWHKDGSWNEYLRITNTGNVGIGTTSPSHPLTVETTDGFNGQIAKFVRNNTSGGWLDLANNEGRFGLGTDNNEFYLYDRTDNAYRMVVDTSGNVGIGTTSPMQKLDVDGRIVANSSDPALIIRETDGSADENWWITSTNGQLQLKTVNDDLVSGWVDKLVVNQNGNVGIGTTEAAAKLEVIGDTQYNNGSGGVRVSTSNGSTANTIWMQASSVDDAATIQSYKIGTGAGVKSLLLNPNGGNVGIGTTNPSSGKLQVSQTSDTSAFYVYQSKNDGGSSNAAYILDDRGYAGVNSGTALRIRSWDTGNDTGDILVLERTNGSVAPVLNVKTSGNVGIGTTSPSEKLTIDNGNIMTAGGSPRFRAYETDSGAIWEIGGGGNGKFFLVDDTGGADNIRMTVDSSGNVGIDTSGPVAKLHVADNGASAGDRLVQIGDDGWFSDEDISNTIGLRGVQSGGSFGYLKANITSPSSREYKKNISEVGTLETSEILKVIDELEIVRFHLKSEDENIEKHLGVIAEDAPSLVQDRYTTSGINQYDYSSLALFGTKVALEQIRTASSTLAAHVAQFDDLSTLLATGSTTATSTFSTVSDGDTIWSRIVRLASAFKDGVLKLATAEFEYVKSDRVETNTLCVGEICVTEAEFEEVFGRPADEDDEESDDDEEPVEEEDGSDEGGEAEEEADGGEETGEEETTSGEQGEEGEGNEEGDPNEQDQENEEEETPPEPTDPATDPSADEGGEVATDDEPTDPVDEGAGEEDADAEEDDKEQELVEESNDPPPSDPEEPTEDASDDGDAEGGSESGTDGS